MAHDRITATVNEHTIVLPLDVDWPDGMKVVIEPAAQQGLTLAELFKKYDGIATDLPEDLAENLDHYLHGHPKK
ncbi:MAG: hypothetical protein ACHQNE_03425 [Candidatus Kapaibacterium sp.]